MNRSEQYHQYISETNCNPSRARRPNFDEDPFHIKSEIFTYFHKNSRKFIPIKQICQAFFTTPTEPVFKKLPKDRQEDIQSLASHHINALRESLNHQSYPRNIYGIRGYHYLCLIRNDYLPTETSIPFYLPLVPDFEPQSEHSQYIMDQINLVERSDNFYMLQPRFSPQSAHLLSLLAHKPLGNPATRSEMLLAIKSDEQTLRTVIKGTRKRLEKYELPYELITYRDIGLLLIEKRAPIAASKFNVTPMF